LSAEALAKPQGFTSLSRQAQLHIFTLRQPHFTEVWFALLVKSLPAVACEDVRFAHL
jgi:hypothetical protein